VDEIQNKGDAIQNKVDEISTKVDEIQNKEDEIQNNEDEIQNKVDVIQNKVDEIIIKVDEINKVVDIKSNKQSELEQVNKCETNEIEISNVSKDESAFRVEMDRVEELELNPSQIEINEAPPIVHEHNPVEAVNPFNHVNPFETDQVVRDETDRANLSIESFESIECMPETETPVLSPIVCLRRSLRLRDGKREKSDKRVSFDPLTLLVNKFNLID
jgi:chromosome segregation ATPase